jgi:hypothetical protein
VRELSQRAPAVHAFGTAPNYLQPIKESGNSIRLIKAPIKSFNRSSHYLAAVSVLRALASQG